MGRLIDVSDDRFWKILFDEACVEGQQADRINDELEEIIAYDVEAVVKELEELKQIEMNDECPMDDICGDCECSKHKCKGCYTSKAIDIVRNGGAK